GSERHRAHVAGAVRSLSDHKALGVEQADREVLAFAGLLGVRGAVDSGADLDRDRLETAPDDPEGNRIQLTHEGKLTSRLAHSSTSATAPGGSTVVESGSSTTAGPVRRAPTGRPARS